MEATRRWIGSKNSPTQQTTPTNPARRLLLRPSDQLSSSPTSSSPSSTSTSASGSVVYHEENGGGRAKSGTESETLQKILFAKTKKSEEEMKQYFKRTDSFGKEEPEHVRRIKAEVKKDVVNLVRDRKLYLMEHIALFYLKDSKGTYAKQTYLRLSKNHQVLQFGDLSACVSNGKDFHLPMRIVVSDIGLVEDKTEEQNGGGHHDTEYRIQFFNKVYREWWQLITNNEADHATWLEGLSILTGTGPEGQSALASFQALLEIEYELRLWHHEHADNVFPDAVNPPKNFDFCDGTGMSESIQEHWRISNIVEE